MMIFAIIIFLLGNNSNKILDLTNIEFNLILGCTVIVIVTSILIKLGILKSSILKESIIHPELLAIKGAELVETSDKLQVLEVNEDINLRCLNINMVNKRLLADTDLFKGIYNTIMDLEEFINFSYNKIIILSVVLVSEKEHSLHSNIYINNDTTFNEYYDTIKNQLDRYNNLQHGYHNEQISRFVIKVWNVDHHKNLKIKQTFQAGNVSYSSQPNITKRCYSTIIPTNKWYKSLIKPLSIYNAKGELKLKHTKPIFTFDLETISINNKEVVISISSCGIFKGFLENKIFLINKKSLITNPQVAELELFSKYFKYLENIIKNDIIHNNKLTIFAHNLGNFDGYFLYKNLLLYYPVTGVNCLIDESNTFISINLNHGFNFEWKDSLRIFPMSLDKLCRMFAVEGKTLIYNNNFRNINLFDNPILLEEFIQYSKQDSLILYYALTNAQQIYYDKFKIDIESVYSTATLSLKIFRTHFLDKPIFTLPSNIDLQIRNGYYGGGTDVYKKYGKNLHYYDVNSLYPSAMLNTMPYELISKGIIDLSNRSLQSFFGFCIVEINCPLNMLRPVLPFHHEGKTIYPVGNWIGCYFSEELKAVEKLGYQIKMIKGLEFSKTNLFSGFVHHFYNEKKFAFGVERDTAKLQLNNLYGYFGRKIQGIITHNIHNDQLINILLTRVVKSIKPINDNYTTVLAYSNINYNMLEQLNNQFNSIGSDNSFVMSNVAIAAAVTSYARIAMIPIKIDPNTLYTDTDSAFTSKPINPDLLGIELGQYKDELKGQVIAEAYFLGQKKYGYYIIDNEGNQKEFSVFSGVPRNSLSFEDIKNISQGKTIIKYIPNKFFKSFIDLNITIKDTKLTIKNTNTKELINNIYLPPKINKGYHNYFENLYIKFKNIIIRNIKKMRKF